MYIVAALDIGHSSVKALGASPVEPTARTRAVFPTCVIPALSLSDDASLASAAKETVKLKGEEYFFGSTAKIQSSSHAFIGENRDWIFTPAHDVLLLGGVKQVLDAYAAPPERFFLVLGLPADNFAAHREALALRALDVVSPYLNELSPSTRLHIRVQAQPYGVLQNLVFLQAGEINQKRNIDQESWGVIDIGHFTTDYLLFEDRVMVERAFGSSNGVGAVYQQVTQAFGNRSLPNDLKTVDHAIRARTVKVYGKPVDVSDIVVPIVDAFGQKIVDEAKRRFGERLSTLDGVLVAGGGASLVFDSIVAALPHSTLPSDPQFTVAEGFARFGLFLATRSS